MFEAKNIPYTRVSPNAAHGKPYYTTGEGRRLLEKAMNAVAEGLKVTLTIREPDRDLEPLETVTRGRDHIRRKMKNTIYVMDVRIEK